MCESSKLEVMFLDTTDFTEQSLNDCFSYRLLDADCVEEGISFIKKELE